MLKEAALFVPSGTMSNAIAIRTHTNPGDEIITEATSHIYIYEGGGFEHYLVVQLLWFRNRGIMAPEDVKKAIRKADGSLAHFQMGLLFVLRIHPIEWGGTCYPQEHSMKLLKLLIRMIVRSFGRCAFIQCISCFQHTCTFSSGL